MARGYYGNTAGTSLSHYRAYIEYRTTKQEETRAWVQRKFSIRVDDGNFWGSHIAKSWGGTVELYGAGWYGDSGWQDVGWVNYGATHTSSCSASYTSNSSGYQISNCTATYTPDVPTWSPNAPTGISVSRRSNTQNVVTWTRNASTARPYSSLTVERAVDGGSWSVVATLSGSATSYTDNSTSANHRYAYRVKATNAAGTSGYSTSGWVYNSPNAPSSCSVTRNSDTANTIAWTRGSSDSGFYSGHKIERQVNGGSWTQIATVGGSATTYTDTTTSANNYYAYRVRSYNPAGDSGYATSGTVYNTPAAPGKPSMARVTDTAVKGTFSNGANTATALDVQRSTDRSNWTALTSVSGKVTTFADNPGGGTFYYRIRNTRGSLVSAWVYSDGIVTICAPNAPTINAPASSAVVPKSQQSIAVRWTHNPIDGSAQTAAQVRWSTDGGSTWTTQDVSGNTASYSLSNDFGVNDAVSIQVRTKGSHADYGPWSASRMFYVYQVPTVTVEQPANDFTAVNMPIHVEVAYSDPSGTLAQAIMNVYSDDVIVYTRDITSALEFDISASEWLPASGYNYTITVNVRSTSTLQASTSRDFMVEFEPPSMVVVDAVPNPDTGYVTITVRKINDGLQEVESCALYRVVNGETTLLANNLIDGDVYVDKYAPLNIDYSYMTAAIAASGAVSQGMFPGKVKSKWMFFYWDDEIARAWLGPDDPFKVEPEHTLVPVAGNEFPVAVMSDKSSETHDVSATVIGWDEMMKFYDLARSHKTAVYKTLYGHVFRAVVVPSISRVHPKADLWTISLQVTRISGDAL
ncbi:MAG: fibronectin type III domain-containing protein [Eggerthellaceae bacterium]|nr:fibronectin type III domain-containing protein [Eggerthellaceae bacterium]